LPICRETTQHAMCLGFTLAVRRSMSITEFAHSLGWKQAWSVQHLAASGRRLHIWTPPLADSVAQPRTPRQHVSMAVNGRERPSPEKFAGEAQRHNAASAEGWGLPSAAFGLWQRERRPRPELWSSTPDLLRPFCAMALAARQRVGLSTPGTTFSQVLPPPRRAPAVPCPRGQAQCFFCRSRVRRPSPARAPPPCPPSL